MNTRESEKASGGTTITWPCDRKVGKPITSRTGDDALSLYQ